MADAQQTKVGTVEGTGSAINVPIGFVPDYVEVFNYDDAGEKYPLVKWWKGMADGSGLKINANSVAIAKITSGGISAYDGSDTAGSEAAPGFTIGTDADLNASGETLFYTAHRNG